MADIHIFSSRGARTISSQLGAFRGSKMFRDAPRVVATNQQDFRMMKVEPKRFLNNITTIGSTNK